MQPIHKACMYGQKAAVDQVSCVLQLLSAATLLLLGLSVLLLPFSDSLQADDPTHTYVQLFELGADIKCTTNWGSTCLHWIVKGSSPLSLHLSFFLFLSHKQSHSHTHTLTHTRSQSVSNMQTDTHVFSHRLCIPQGRRNCRHACLFIHITFTLACVHTPKHALTP